MERYFIPNNFRSLYWFIYHGTFGKCKRVTGIFKWCKIKAEKK